MDSVSGFSPQLYLTEHGYSPDDGSAESEYAGFMDALAALAQRSANGGDLTSPQSLADIAYVNWYGLNHPEHRGDIYTALSPDSVGFFTQPVTDLTASIWQWCAVYQQNHGGGDPKLWLFVKLAELPGEFGSSSANGLPASLAQFFATGDDAYLTVPILGALSVSALVAQWCEGIFQRAIDSGSSVDPKLLKAYYDLKYLYDRPTKAVWIESTLSTAIFGTGSFDSPFIKQLLSFYFEQNPTGGNTATDSALTSGAGGTAEWNAAANAVRASDFFGTGRVSGAAYFITQVLWEQGLSGKTLDPDLLAKLDTVDTRAAAFVRATYLHWQLDHNKDFNESYLWSLYAYDTAHATHFTKDLLEAQRTARLQAVNSLAAGSNNGVSSTDAVISTATLPQTTRVNLASLSINGANPGVGDRVTIWVEDYNDATHTYGARYSAGSKILTQADVANGYVEFDLTVFDASGNRVWLNDGKHRTTATFADMTGVITLSGPPPSSDDGLTVNGGWWSSHVPQAGETVGITLNGKVVGTQLLTSSLINNATTFVARTDRTDPQHLNDAGVTLGAFYYSSESTASAALIVSDPAPPLLRVELNSMGETPAKVGDTIYVHAKVWSPQTTVNGVVTAGHWIDGPDMVSKVLTERDIAYGYVMIDLASVDAAGATHLLPGGLYQFTTQFKTLEADGTVSYSSPVSQPLTLTIDNTAPSSSNVHITGWKSTVQTTTSSGTTRYRGTMTIDVQLDSIGDIDPTRIRLYAGDYNLGGTQHQFYQCTGATIDVQTGRAQLTFDISNGFGGGGYKDPNLAIIQFGAGSLTSLGGVTNAEFGTMQLNATGIASNPNLPTLVNRTTPAAVPAPQLSDPAAIRVWRKLDPARAAEVETEFKNAGLYRYYSNSEIGELAYMYRGVSNSQSRQNKIYAFGVKSGSEDFNAWIELYASTSDWQASSGTDSTAALSATMTADVRAVLKKFKNDHPDLFSQIQWVKDHPDWETKTLRRSDVMTLNSQVEALRKTAENSLNSLTTDYQQGITQQQTIQKMSVDGTKGWADLYQSISGQM